MGNCGILWLALGESVHHMLPIEAKIENSSMLELFMTPAD